MDIKYKIRKIKWFFQRIFRGYSDEDLWNLDWFILQKIRKPFKAFVKYQKENGHGCPIDLYDMGNHENESHKWTKVLEQIEEAIDLKYEDDSGADSWLDKTLEQQIKDDKKIDKGFRLFGKYFNGLWD